MTSTTTKPNSSQPAAEMAVDLFDNWFDPIEIEVRARAREFIEAMIRGELDTVLARPRYRRTQIAGNEAAAGIAGHRHEAGPLSLTGTFGPIEIAVPRARLSPRRDKTTDWSSQALRAYQRRTLAADALIASTYLAGTNTRRVRRALAALFGGAVGKDTVSRTWRKVKSDWDAWNSRSLAEDPIGSSFSTAPWARPARPLIDLDLAPRRHRRTWKRPKGGARDQEHGWREHRRLAHRPRRPHQARIASPRVPHRRWRARARQGNRRRVGRGAGSALHGPQAQEPFRARARAPA